MKIVQINELSIVFDNGNILKSFHERQCRERHYLDFSLLENYNISSKTGETINIYEQEFNFDKGVTFERVEDMGILLLDTDGNKYLVNGYGENNGWYSADIELIYCTKNGDVIYSYDVSECQDAELV